MKREKTVQISEKLMLMLYRYFSLEEYLDEHQKAELKREISKAIEEKSESMYRRWLYTRSKTAETEEEREKARREYLDEVGIPSDFRW